MTSVYVAWKKGAKTIEEPAAYAHRVLVNTYISKRRRKSSHEIPTDNFADVADRGSDIALSLALSDALDQLKRIDRAIVIMRYYEDRTVEETANVLRLSAGAVRNRSMRALAKLRATMPLEVTEQS